MFIITLDSEFDQQVKRFPFPLLIMICKFEAFCHGGVVYVGYVHKFGSSRSKFDDDA